MKPSDTLVPINRLFQALGRAIRPGQEAREQLVKELGLVIVAESNLGSGSVRFITQTQFDEVVAREKAKTKTAKVIGTAGESRADLHVGALETKIDRLVDIEKENTHAINELIKAHNLTLDRLNRILKEMGVTQ